MLKKVRQSHIWERDPFDYYIEPPWCSRRLFEEETFEGTIVDPCAGTGRILFSARAAGYPIIACDIVKRSWPATNQMDFMADQHGRTWDNIVSNPPFGICDPGEGRPKGLVELALERTRQKCALLMPVNWLQGDRRSRWLVTTPLYKVLMLTPRPSMPPGALVEAGTKPSNGTRDFAWFIWLKGFKGPPQLGWLRRGE